MSDNCTITQANQTGWLRASLRKSATCLMGMDRPGRPYSDFDIEQHAQIVQDWFTKREAAGHELDADPYFIYIRDNIRAGNLFLNLRLHKADGGRGPAGARRATVTWATERLSPGRELAGELRREAMDNGITGLARPTYWSTS